jgi:hypothetical protein
VESFFILNCKRFSVVTVTDNKVNEMSTYLFLLETKVIN